MTLQDAMVKLQIELRELRNNSPYVAIALRHGHPCLELLSSRVEELLHLLFDMVAELPVENVTKPTFSIYYNEVTFRGDFDLSTLTLNYKIVWDVFGDFNFIKISSDVGSHNSRSGISTNSIPYSMSKTDNAPLDIEPFKEALKEIFSLTIPQRMEEIKQYYKAATSKNTTTRLHIPELWRQYTTLKKALDAGSMFK